MFYFYYVLTVIFNPFSHDILESGNHHIVQISIKWIWPDRQSTRPSVAFVRRLKCSEKSRIQCVDSGQLTTGTSFFWPNSIIEIQINGVNMSSSSLGTGLIPKKSWGQNPALYTEWTGRPNWSTSKSSTSKTSTTKTSPFCPKTSSV
jgi:hypothetical protein